MPLTVTIRKSTGALTITGYVNGERVQRRAQSNDQKLAEEEAALLEAQLLREQFHGKRRGTWCFAYACEQYRAALHPRPATVRRLIRLCEKGKGKGGIGETPLRDIDQQVVNGLQSKMLRPNPAPATILREIITPVRTVINYAVEQSQADPVKLRTPKVPSGRTLYLLPNEAERLIAAAAPHLQPLLIFQLCVGPRLSESLELDWNDTKLSQGLASFWKTKGNRERHASLPPRAVAALANLPERAGAVFRWERRIGQTIVRQPYAAHDREERDGGGQIKTAFAGAVRRAGLNPEFTVHDLRHTWATWHYAIHKDLLKLHAEGGWSDKSSLNIVRRYAHRMPEGHEAAIGAFWSTGDQTVTGSVTTALSA